MDPLRVFISSTSVDLLEYRQAAHDAIMGLDHHPVDMIYWSADPRSGTMHSLDRVRHADVLILLLAHRYGYVPDGAEQSVTEQEYRAARDADMPVLAFFLDPAAPWPPDHVEWEAKERLAAFKALVESEVTKKVFRTPAELATQVVQSLALLMRRPAIRRPARRFRGRGVPEVSLPVRLLSEPDVLVPIGTAEDGLPLLLDVRRSHDLSGLFAQLAGSTDRTTPQALLDTFRQSLKEFGNQAWASDRIMPVVSKTRGSLEVRQRLYVSSFTLTGPFTSILASISGAPVTGRRAARRRTALSTARSRPFQGAVGSLAGSFNPRAELQSSGGSNRFLAMPPEDGTTHSVGWLQEEGFMVEWRPFVCESVLKTFPEAVFSLFEGSSALKGPVSQAPDLLMTELADYPRDGFGRFDVQMRVDVQAQAAMRVVGAVARELATLHDAGKVHGDIKPHNVLITEQGVMLIDSFDVEFEQPSPGWTPGWSAPEQVLGLPLTPAADVYPLAVMVGSLLGGELVGEVRKYRIPEHLTGQNEFDVFHNPSLFVDSDAARASVAGQRAWRRLVERGLRFDPDQRPASVLEFAAEIDELAVEHPLSGVLSFEPSGSLSAARLVDGTDAIARVINDWPGSSFPVPSMAPTSLGYGRSLGYPPPPDSR